MVYPGPPRWDSFSAPRRPRPFPLRRRPPARGRPLLLLLVALMFCACLAAALYQAAHPEPLHFIYPTSTPTEDP